MVDLVKLTRRLDSVYSRKLRVRKVISRKAMNRAKVRLCTGYEIEFRPCSITYHSITRISYQSLQDQKDPDDRRDHPVSASYASSASQALIRVRG